MQRLIKFIVISLVVIIIGFGAASIFLSKFVDPNQYKDRITTLINEKTGYQVALNGNISWTLFPTVGISVEDINLKARTDTPTPFMTLKQATISVKLLPLLDKQVQMDAVSVDGLSMILSVDQRGNGNWQTTLSNSSKKINTLTPTAEVLNTLASTENKKPTPAMDIDIATIDVSHAEILYEDARTQKNIKITNLSLTSNDISSTSIFPIKIAFDLNATNPSINGHIDITSDALFNIKDNLFNFTHLFIKSSLSGVVFGEKTVPLSLTGIISADNSKQKITLSEIVIDFSNMKINTNIEYNMRNSEYKGDLSIPAFDLSAFRESISQSNDSRKPPSPSKLALDGTIAGNQQYVFLNNIELLLNDIPLTARVGISSFATNTLDITANGNQIDVEALLAALGKDPRMSGILTFSTHLTTSGSGDDATKNLNGNGQFDILNATLKGENLTQKLCDAIATLHKTQSTQARGNDTHFDALKGSFAIQNGVVRSQDLTAQMKGANVKAQAASDILQQSIDATIGVTVIGDSDDIACSVNEKFQNIALPITCKGTYDTEPGKMCGVDKEGLSDIAKGVLIEKATQKLEDKYGPGVKGALDKLFGN